MKHLFIMYALSLQNIKIGNNSICWQVFFKEIHSGLTFCLSGKAVPECSTSVVKTTSSVVISQSSVRNP